VILKSDIHALETNLNAKVSLLNKSLGLAPALGATKFIIVKDMILVTLFSLSLPDVLDVYDDTTPVINFLQQQRQKKKTFSNLIVSKRE